ncbi:serine/threonine protein kinase [Cystobacter fuscus]|uniref:serine/threonine protein kinase n=1 Tax=Cystobacter fuscus TaxID=43 RepID=UPI002B2E534E|nr:serine/threonine protein kinase [Cystobacter fuscus]
MRIARDEAPDEPLGLNLLPGAEVAGFIIERRLAAGSFGALYQARRGRKRFAIKLVPRDARGEREVDALRRVQELPVVGFHGYGLWPEEKPRFIVLALELVEGVALDTWAREFNPSTSELLTQVMLPLVSTLGQLHAAGVVHRDVKEANIVMRQQDGHPVLVDFGAAGFEGAHRLTLRLPPGTPEYRSPEVVRFAREWEGEPPPGRPGDDLWALGVTLYALLTRTLPFGDRHGPLAQSILEDEPEPPHVRNPRVPATVGELCLRLLAKEPAERPADASALERDLKAALAGADAAWDEPLFDGGRKPLPPAAPCLPLIPEPALAPEPRRRPMALALGALATVFLTPATPLQESTALLPTSQDVSRHEMAEVDMTGEVVSSAGLQKSPPPAPVAHATNPAETPMRPSAKNRRLIITAAATAAVCTTPACVSGPKPAPPLPAEPCPEGSQETHVLLGMGPRASVEVWLDGYVEEEKEGYRTYPPIFVKPGPITAQPKVRIFPPGSGMRHPLPLIPKRTIFRGQLYTRENRVYGRFTEVTRPGEEPMPICMELDESSKTRGIETSGGTRDNPEVFPVQSLEQVREFRPIPSR